MYKICIPRFYSKFARKPPSKTCNTWLVMSKMWMFNCVLRSADGEAQEEEYILCCCLRFSTLFMGESCCSWCYVLLVDFCSCSCSCYLLLLVVFFSSVHLRVLYMYMERTCYDDLMLCTCNFPQHVLVEYVCCTICLSSSYQHDNQTN